MRAKELFEDWTDSTTLIFGDYPVSDCRFVTIEVSSYLLEKEGINASVHLRVWNHRQLEGVVYIDIRHILDAADGKRYRTRKEYPPEIWVSLEDDGPFVKISTFRHNEDTDEDYDKWTVVLNKDELAFLKERFKPLTERR